MDLLAEKLMSHKLVAKLPSKCTPAELAVFECFVKTGGEVITGGFRELLMQAQKLVFLYEEDENVGQALAGVAALKNPRNSYKKKVFQQAHSPESPTDYVFEAGWIFVDKKYRERGHSQNLLKTVLDLAGNSPVYVTTREKNQPMRKTNDHCGLKKSGSPYLSEDKKYNLVLYLWRKAP